MRTVSMVLVPFSVLILARAAAFAEPSEKLRFFETKIRPVLVKHCYSCHSAKSRKLKGGLRLDVRKGWENGGDSGPAIIPGQPGRSLLLDAISGTGVATEMPPDGRLPGQVIQDFRTWIGDGAVDPRDGELLPAKHRSVDITTGRTFWAFQPRRKFTSQRTIDSFIEPRMSPARADQLVRRLFLDLIGLPPSQRERREFQALYQSESPAKAVSVFADRLLARPEFGEKWARHWLDIARYADSNGGDFNLTYPEAWRYRNYVIDAFNDDLPYDQFIREQIAGDLLPHSSSGQRNRQLVATGFLMVAAKMLTERNKAKMHLDIADEQIDTIGRAIMGLTLGCARCHDHKFDPIPTSDYYAMAGILHSTRTADRVLMDNINVTGWTETELAVDDETLARIKTHAREVRELEAELVKLKKQMADSGGIVVDDTDAVRQGPWRKSTLRPNHVGNHYLATDRKKGPYSITWKAAIPDSAEYEVQVAFGGGSGLASNADYTIKHARGATSLRVDQTVRPSVGGLWHPIGRFLFSNEAEVTLTDSRADGHVIADAIRLVRVAESAKDDSSSMPAVLARMKTVQDRIAKLKETTPKIPRAMAAMDNRNDRMGDLGIRIRGEAQNVGTVIPRGFLQVIPVPEFHQITIPVGQSGRVELAEWLTHSDHPLTPRVMANRIWQHLFGRGIVATSDNFGARGVAPSHPELLDFLANEFVTNQWSVKSLIRSIVQSKTWQQAAAVGTDDDPGNTAFQRQNRRPVPAETLRDSILATSGRLDRRRRESVVDQLGTFAIATSGARHSSLGETGTLLQRSVYMPIIRGAIAPSLAVFDFPNPDLVSGNRATTTVPAQALFLLNSPFVRDSAHALAEGLPSSVSIEETVRTLYERILIREADEEDIRNASASVREAMHGGMERTKAVAQFIQVLWSSAEFRFVE